MTLVLTEAERRVLARMIPPPVSEWADQNVFLPAKDNALGGPYKSDFAPYQREMMDALTDPYVEDVVFVTPTQVGKTQVQMNLLQYLVDQAPGPTLLVHPSENDVEEFNLRRLKPQIMSSPAVRRHMTGRRVDWKKDVLAFDSMNIYCAGAHSPAALAGKPIQNLFMDEIDKFPPFAGEEADPISLAKERTKTFTADRRHFYCSTPSTESGYIWRLWLKSDQAKFLVPCTGCGHFHTMEWANLKWPEDERDPEVVERDRLAWMVCPACGQVFEDNERDKRDLLRRGIWVQKGAEVVNGQLSEERSHRSRGFHLNTLYSPWVSFSAVAAEFLRSQGDIGALLNFTNSWMAQPWKEVEAETTDDHLKSLEDSYPRGTVPEEALVLTAGVDIGKHWIHYVIRAWGVRERSWLVEAARVPRAADSAWRDEIGQLLCERGYAKPSGDVLPVRKACVDYGYDPDEVVRFCRTYPDVAVPVKGYQAVSGLPATPKRLERTVDGKPCGLRLWSLDVTHFKTKTHRFMHAPEGGHGVWKLHRDSDEDYRRHLLSEHLVLKRTGKNKQAHSVWEKRPAGGENHWWDCEVYATAAAHIGRVHVFVPEEDRGKRQSLASQMKRKPKRGSEKRAGFVSAERGRWLKGRER